MRQFERMITARNTDIGDLINSEAAPRQRPIYFTSPDRHRACVCDVPESIREAFKPGATEADIVLAEFPGSKVSRKSRSEPPNRSTVPLVHF